MAKRATILLALLVGAAVLLYVALPQLSRSRTLRLKIERTIEEATGLEISIGSIAVDPDLVLRITDFSVADPGRDPFFSLDALEVDAPWAVPSGGGYSIGAVRAEGFAAYLDHLPEGDDDDTEGDRADADGGEPVAVEFASIAAAGRVILPSALADAGCMEEIAPVRFAATTAGDALRWTLELSLPGVGDPVRAGGTAESPLSEASASLFELSAPGLDLAALAPCAGGDVASSVLAGTVSLSVAGRAGRDGIDVTLSERGVVIADAEFDREGAGLRLGEVSVTGTASGRVDATARAELDVVYSGVSANDPEFLKLVEGLEGTARLEAALNEDAALAGNARFAVGSGELLFDRYYLDFSQYAPSGSAGFEASGDAVSLRDVRATLRRIGGWAGQVDLAGDRLELDGHFEIIHIGRLLDIAVREPFKQSYPALEETYAEGVVTGDAVVVNDVDRGWSVVGRAQLAGGKLVWKSPDFQVTGLSLDVPIAVGTGPVRAPARRGRIALEHLQVGELDLGRVGTTIVTEPNAFRFLDPLAVDLFEGRVAIESIDARDILGHPMVTGAFEIDALELAAATKEFEMPPVDGMLSGRLDSFVYEDDNLTTEGGFELLGFGGRMTIDGVSVADVTSPVPGLGLGIAFRDFDLSKLTAAIELGRVTGILEGEVTDLVIVDGQPVSMNARVETVSRRGVRQAISVTALDQISILGGSDAGALSRGIVGLFDEYRYSKMGFTSTLDNDRFTLRGIERSGGKDLLVVGSLLPPTVNVVSHSQVISFSEMVRRLSRIRETGGPAVGP